MSEDVPLSFIAEQAMVEWGSLVAEPFCSPRQRVFLLSSPGAMFLFDRPKRNGNGRQPLALLLSSPKEVSKKGATVSGRWTPTRGTYPLDSSPRKQRCHLSKPGCSALPCGPRVRATLPAAKQQRKRQRISRIQHMQDKAELFPKRKQCHQHPRSSNAANLPAVGEPSHPACRVRPGAGVDGKDYRSS